MPVNPFMNPCLFSVLSSYSDPMLSTMKMPTSQSPFGPQSTPVLRYSHLLENTAECFSQSSESSKATESALSTPDHSQPERNSSPESCGTASRIRRERPQQDITDNTE
ncbi:unnamed protein product [Heligmosomoides polygyrus]|uniref:Homeobox domain-containing protein n=1 Tax=Heligmosomoides polygyrus TaxID=6339 RepID=A0A183G6S0_HELPZ|nr:unnamed protein product [Heligmosomoides polygyrus]